MPLMFPQNYSRKQFNQEQFKGAQESSGANEGSGCTVSRVLLTAETQDLLP